MVIAHMIFPKMYKPSSAYITIQSSPWCDLRCNSCEYNFRWFSIFGELKSSCQFKNAPNIRFASSKIIFHFYCMCFYKFVYKKSIHCYNVNNGGVIIISFSSTICRDRCDSMDNNDCNGRDNRSHSRTHVDSIRNGMGDNSSNRIRTLMLQPYPFRHRLLFALVRHQLLPMVMALTDPTMQPVWALQRQRELH